VAKNRGEKGRREGLGKKQGNLAEQTGASGVRLETSSQSSKEEENIEQGRRAEDVCTRDSDNKKADEKEQKTTFVS